MIRARAQKLYRGGVGISARISPKIRETDRQEGGGWTKKMVRPTRIVSEEDTLPASNHGD